VSLAVGVDLAWGPGTATRPANETGIAVLDDDGAVVDAGWERGLDAVLARLRPHLVPGALVAIDAPLVVANATGMRECEREVAQRYMHPWRVGANPSNLARADLAGVTLRIRLEAEGVAYLDGIAGPAHDGPAMFECYPYTTLVGTPELGYDLRPRYKRMPRAGTRDDARRLRAAEHDELVRRLDALGARTGVPLDLGSHPATGELRRPAPLVDAAYKHREDLLDAVIAAWTALAWRLQPERFQVLGATSAPDAAGRRATIVAPARPEQRR